jgi:hypothetical protein
MTSTIFPDFRPETRLWIYAFPRKLNEQERTLVQSKLEDFVREWKSHQDDVRGEFQIAYDQFVFLAGESIDKISGCSIDSSVRVFKALREHHDLDALDRGRVFYREGEEIRSISRTEFQKLVDADKIGADTIVFDNSIHTVGDLHDGKWELPFQQSWHAGEFAG